MLHILTSTFLTKTCGEGYKSKESTLTHSKNLWIFKKEIKSHSQSISYIDNF